MVAHLLQATRGDLTFFSVFEVTAPPHPFHITVNTATRTNSGHSMAFACTPPEPKTEALVVIRTQHRYSEETASFSVAYQPTVVSDHWRLAGGIHNHSMLSE